MADRDDASATGAAITGAGARLTLAAALRQRLPGKSWEAVRTLCRTGKVRVDGTVALDPAARLPPGAALEIDMTARRPSALPPGFRVVFDDRHLIVIEKPSGVSSVPYERKETGTALDLVRAHWRAGGLAATRTPLFVVHRLDKDTSGLMCFSKTRAAERGLHETFQKHLATRAYLAVVHGTIASASERIESTLVEDRGDGLRGSTRVRRPGGSRVAGGPTGKRAVTHLVVLERLPAATLCRVTLETGRTHQIRIHLAEKGHPIVGDDVYTRDLLRGGSRPLAAEQLMLHAATLGFAHPITGTRLDFECEPPPAFQAVLARLGHREKHA